MSNSLVYLIYPNMKYLLVKHEMGMACKRGRTCNPEERFPVEASEQFENAFSQKLPHLIFIGKEGTLKLDVW